jgi:GTP-binding protein
MSADGSAMSEKERAIASREEGRLDGGGFSAEEIEAGRKLFAGDWQFGSAGATLAALPAAAGIEVAFAGRSNVGKSSLINALTARRALARISRAPGRTRELVFFAAGKGVTLVDMPGYGYATAPKAIVGAWTGLIHAYLAGRANLCRVLVLIDARRGVSAADEAIFTTLDQAAVSYQLVLTKADQVKQGELARCMSESAAQIARRPAAYPEVLATSARTGAGIAALRATLARLVAERLR